MEGTLQVLSSKLVMQLPGLKLAMWCGSYLINYMRRSADRTKVFGPSTDYRDIRKAAYQEYLVTTDFNVARAPTGLPVNLGAALGVAFVSALLALGISLGLDFSRVQGAPFGPDILGLLRKSNRDEIPEDVRDECFDGIKDEERPQVGDWVAIWGGKCSPCL